MTKTLLIMPALLFVFGMGYAYAEPLDDTSVTVLNYDGISTTLKIEWNPDEVVAKYELRCVSCMPNISEMTQGNSIILDGVTRFPNTPNAMLYMIAYDSKDEIIRAKQILVTLE